MTRAEEVIYSLIDRFLCECGTSYPLPGKNVYQECSCGSCWGFAADVAIWKQEMCHSTFKFVDTRTGWATWRSR